MAVADPVTVGVLSLHTSKETKAILQRRRGSGTRHRVASLREHVRQCRRRESDARARGGRHREQGTSVEYRTARRGTRAGKRVLSVGSDTQRTDGRDDGDPQALDGDALASNDERTPDVTLALSGEQLNAARDRYGARPSTRPPSAPTVVGRGRSAPTIRSTPRSVTGMRSCRNSSTKRTFAIAICASTSSAARSWLRCTATRRTTTGEPTSRSADRSRTRLTTSPTRLAKWPSAHRISSASTTPASTSSRATRAGSSSRSTRRRGSGGLYEATQMSPAPYIAKLAIERAGGEVDDERVRISRTSSTTPGRQHSPGCEGQDTEPAVIGYTEEVILSGTSGSKTVLAKSDTGATRTSIDTSLAADIGAGRSSLSPAFDPVAANSQESPRRRRRRRRRRQPTHRHGQRRRPQPHGYPSLLGRDILGNYQVDVGRRIDSDAADTPEEEEDE